MYHINILKNIKIRLIMGGNDMVHFVKERDFLEYVRASSALDNYLRDCDGWTGAELNAWRFFEEAEILLKNKLLSAKDLDEYSDWCKSKEAEVLKARADALAVQCKKSRAKMLVDRCLDKFQNLFSI
jgi:hypothetical protein